MIDLKAEIVIGDRLRRSLKAGSMVAFVTVLFLFAPPPGMPGSCYQSSSSENYANIVVHYPLPYKDTPECNAFEKIKDTYFSIHPFNKEKIVEPYTVY